MKGGEAVDGLIEGGIFEAAGEDKLTLPDSFTREVETYRKTFEKAEREEATEALTEVCGDAEAAERLYEGIGAGDDRRPEFLARYAALIDRKPTLAPAQALTGTVIVGNLKCGLPRSDGVPNPFLPVRIEDLAPLVSLARRSIVYIWREECDPCDAVRRDFENIFANGPPEDLLLFAVYGAEDPELLKRRYDVIAAPTTLFTVDGRVDSRLLGAPSWRAIEVEIETIRSRGESSET